MQLRKTMNLIVPEEIIEKYPDVFKTKPKAELITIHNKEFLKIEGINELIAVPEEHVNEFTKDFNTNEQNNKKLS